MSKPIEDYAFIGNLLTGCLIARDGSLDWLCLPRFDSPACFAALLGTPDNGRWQIAPADGTARVERCYRDATLILETTFTTDAGEATLIDAMPLIDAEDCSEVVRIVEGRKGVVEMVMEFTLRFGYGDIVPWVRRQKDGLSAVAGPDAVRLICPVDLENRDFTTHGAFTVREGERIAFKLAYHPSHRAMEIESDCERQLDETERWWREWSGRCGFDGHEDHPWFPAIQRSLVTLKGLTYRPTGGIVAAPTTSLPECLGGDRNWDYRYTWIRDATMTLYALVESGYGDEAEHWRDWLLRAAAGKPEQLQIMYGVAGERRLTEFELPHLPGYADSRPVRIGNGAWNQVQHDIFGELMDTLHAARKAGMEPLDDAWALQRTLLDHLAKVWREPDEGVWEMRSGRRHFTHSRLMCWVAFDRAIKAVETMGLKGDVASWRRIRETIRKDILDNGFDRDRNSFVQSYGSTAIDASLLLIGHVGFLACDDPRVLGTIKAVEEDLMVDGFVRRYDHEHADDGFAVSEGAFLVCTYWLADCYAMVGRRDEAIELFERLMSLRNDVGLLAEEYDPQEGRMVGNFPQAFSHIGLVNCARNLLLGAGAASERGEGEITRAQEPA